MSMIGFIIVGCVVGEIFDLRDDVILSHRLDMKECARSCALIYGLPEAVYFQAIRTAIPHWAEIAECVASGRPVALRSVWRSVFSCCFLRVGISK